MKWMLLVLIYGTIPVKTGLLFDTIDDCLKAEEQMRDTYRRTYDAWQAWAEANPKEAQYPDSQKFMWRRDGMETTGRACPTPTNRHLLNDPSAGPSGQHARLLLEQSRMRDLGRFWPGSHLAPRSNPENQRPIGDLDACKSSFAITMSIRPFGR